MSDANGGTVAVTVSADRVVSLAPVPVTFGRTETAERRMVFGDGYRNSPAVQVNGIPMSIYIVMVERGGVWRRDPSNGGGSWRTDKTDTYVKASDNAHRRLWDWAALMAPRLAETHAELFEVAERVECGEAADRWLAAADMHRRFVEVSNDYADLYRMIEDGTAEIVPGHAACDRYKRFKREAPPAQWGNRDGPLTASSAVIAGGELVGIGCSVNRHLTFVPIHLVETY